MFTSAWRWNNVERNWQFDGVHSTDSCSVIPFITLTDQPFVDYLFPRLHVRIVYFDSVMCQISLVGNGSSMLQWFIKRLPSWPFESHMLWLERLLSGSYLGTPSINNRNGRVSITSECLPLSLYENCETLCAGEWASILGTVNLTAVHLNCSVVRYVFRSIARNAGRTRVDSFVRLCNLHSTLSGRHCCRPRWDWSLLWGLKKGDLVSLTGIKIL